MLEDVLSCIFSWQFLIIMYKVAIQRNKKVQGQVQNKEIVPMLSQLYIQLPKPNPLRKISLVNHQQQYITEYQIFPTPQDQFTDNCVIDYHNNERNIPSFHLSKQKVSDFSKNCRSDEEIILGWIKSLFQKKNLLGPHWQEKIKNKRNNLLKSAFERLKEERHSISSPYLQCQSRHKPNFNKQNLMMQMGIDKLNEVFMSIATKSKRTVFSKILRFLAFMHISSKPNSKLDSYALQQESTGPAFSKNIIRDEKNIQEMSPKNTNFIKPIYAKEVLTPKKIGKSNDYIVVQETQFKTPIKQVQSSKNLIFSANQYALSPASPIKQQLTEKVKPRRQNNFIVSDSKMSKNSDKSKINKELVNSKSQPHQLAIGGIGGNFKYEFNQHNYIVVQPENIQMPHQLPIINPPSPLSHQFTSSVKFHTPDVKQINIQPIPLILKSSQHLEPRDTNHARPHSHNPFITPNQQNKNEINQKIVEQKSDSKKSRSISAANIKISFMSKQEMNTKDLRVKANDYHEMERQKYQDIHKLGSAENKKMRQQYQINSFGNELITHDYIVTPQTPNYLYSAPMSPKPPEMYSPNIHVNYVMQNPQSPVTPRSPRTFGYQSFMPASPEPRQVPQQMKQSIHIASIDPSKRVLRQKILVTGSQRQK